MKIRILYSIAFLLSLTTYSQELKNKDVKHAIEDGKVSEISIIADDRFIPERKQEMDLKVTFQNGTSVLASDYHFIWDKTECSVSNAGWKIKGELLANGKGVILPNMLSMYPLGAETAIVISMEFAGKKVTKTLTPNYCIDNYTISRVGTKGSIGSRGSNGYSGGGNGSDGRRGDNGGDGPNIDVQVEEDTIGSKTFMIIIFEGQKYTLDPECSTMRIISRGGEGGNGGRGGNGSDSNKNTKNEYTGSGGNGGRGGEGGDGGKGGIITVSGSAAEKYKSKLTFLSEGGQGGDSGSGGSGGDGKYSGRSGSSRSDGSLGSGGQVVFKTAGN